MSAAAINAPWPAPTGNIDVDHAAYERLLHRVVNTFYDAHGWRMFLDKPREDGYQELLEEAQLYWVQAYRTWDPTQGPLHKRLASCVWWGLFDIYRRVCSRYQKGHTVGVNVDEMEAPNRFDLDRLMEEISPDGRVVTELLLNAPKTSAENKKNAVVRYLQDVGWAGQRIWEALSEIKSTLMG